MVKRFCALLMAWLVVLSLSVPVFASVSRMDDENTYVAEDGSIYTYQDGRVYQLIDGKLYEVINGKEQSIIDVFKNKPGSERPDGVVMGEAQDIIGKTIGVGLSVIIYVFFAMTAFTTACDLAYIGIPAVRGFMYSGGGNGSGMQSGNQYGGIHQGPGMPPHHHHGPNPQNPGSGERKSVCLISQDLRSMVNPQTGSMPPNMMVTYLKRRAVSIVIIVVVFMLLVTSTVFTDFGLNVGSMLYSNAAKFLGF